MKSIFTPILLVLFATTFMSCDPTEEPKANINAFVAAMNEFDIATAKKYATPESQEYLDMFDAFMKENPERKPPATDLTILNCVLEGNTGTCTTCCDYNKGEFTLNVKKVDGVWLVDLSNETQRRPYNEENPAPPETAEQPEIIDGDSSHIAPVDPNPVPTEAEHSADNPK